MGQLAENKLVAGDVVAAAVDVASDDDDAVAVAVVEEVAVDAEAVQVAVPVAAEQAVVDGNDYYLNCVAHWAKPNTNFLWEFYLNGRHLRILNFAVVHALSMYAFYREPQQPTLVAVAVVAGYYSYFDL